MFHDQSAVERGFTTNADMVADNRSDHSIMTLYMNFVHDHMQPKEVDPNEINK